MREDDEDNRWPPDAQEVVHVDPGMHICDECGKRDATWRLGYLGVWYTWYVWLCGKCSIRWTDEGGA